MPWVAGTEGKVYVFERNALNRIVRKRNVAGRAPAGAGIEIINEALCDVKGESIEFELRGGASRAAVHSREPGRSVPGKNHHY